MSDDDLLVLSKEDFDLLHELPACGCGCPELVYDAYRRLLHAYADEGWTPGLTRGERLTAAVGGETLFYVVAYVLDHIEATEHGTSVGGAWITDKGKRLLSILGRYAETGYEATPTYEP